MSNVHDIDHRRERLEQSAVEASAWIARMDQGLGDAEAKALQAWMAADPRNQAKLLEMARMWDKMDALARLSEVFPHASEARPDANRGGRYRMAIAATFAVVFAGLVMTSVITGSSESETAPDRAFDVAAYETAIGGMSTIELSDRSEITLNTDTRAVVSFAQGRRIVNLERGEMHINVAHDPTRPLSVIAGGHVVQAVGTAFSVKVDASQRVEVLVVDGRVRVRAHEPGTGDFGPIEAANLVQHRSLLVTQGERVVLNADREVVEALEPEEIEVRLSWRNGNLMFRGESLATAVEEVSRYTPIEFVIADEDLRKIRVAGLFKRGDVAGFLSTLQANFDIVHERAGDETILLSTTTTPSPSLPEPAASAR